MVKINVFLSGLFYVFDPSSYYGCLYMYNPLDGLPDTAYYFDVFGVSKPSSGPFTTIQITLNYIVMQQGNTYNLGSGFNGLFGAVVPGTNWACYYVQPGNGVNKSHSTTDAVAGQITIAFLDTVKHIVSANFWFDAIAAPGDTAHVREGRFDMLYQH